MLGDVGKGRTGFSWKWAVVLALLVVLGVVAAPGALAKVLSRVFIGKGSEPGLSVPVTNAPAPVAMVASPVLALPVFAGSAAPLVPSTVAVRVPSTNRIVCAVRGARGWFVRLKSGDEYGPDSIARAGVEDERLVWIETPSGERVRWGR